MNSSREPDYHGIELKSSRNPRNRKNLFCKVPDWDISRIKGVSEFIDSYGYMGEDGMKVYRNTISCKSLNSQNLRLNVNYVADLLEMEEDIRRPKGWLKVADVVVWRLQTLHKALLSKHHETFWITVDNVLDEDGCELFRLKYIEHTKNPIIPQFDILLEQGLITVDFLLGRSKVNLLTGKRTGGDTVSFKLKTGAEGLLFPAVEKYAF